MIPGSKQLLPALLTRAILPGALFAVGTGMLLGAADVAQMLLGFLLFLVAAILVSGPLARGLAEPAGNLFWPRRYYDRPQPMYGIPQSRRAKGQLEDALIEYEKIAAAYPNEVRPWLDMVAIAIEDLKDLNRARDIFERGIAQIFEEEKQILAKLAAALPGAQVAQMVDRALPLVNAFLVRAHQRRVRELFQTIGGE